MAQNTEFGLLRLEFIWLLVLALHHARCRAWDLVILHLYHLSKINTAPKFPSTRIL
jgi:hypothetical protein